MSEGTERPGGGKLERAGGRWRLRFERLLPHSPARVWRALTEEAHLAAWFPTTIEGELRVGAPLQFRFRDGEYPTTHGEVIACEDGRVLEFTWGHSDEDIDQPEQSRFELTPDGDGCRLVFMTTYDQVGKSARDAAGWHVCFDRLEAHLAGHEVNLSADPWTPLNKWYAERFGPEAASLGPPDSTGTTKL
jgi:uncharacterized protein YndB with AHSA1/START domain